MSNYKEPEEQLHAKMYTTICKEQFSEIREELNSVREGNEYVRRKIENGLSDLPKRVNWLMGLVFTLILGVAAGIGLWTHKLGRVETLIETQFLQIEETYKDYAN
jgi:hypothetical protein